MVTRGDFSETNLPQASDLRVAIRKASIGQRADRVLIEVLSLCAMFIVIVVIGIGVTMVFQSYPALQRFGPGFISGTAWDPVNQHFGALPFLYGTLVTSAIALVLGGPLALACAIALSELAPRSMRSILSSLVELLAAIPSVVYGLWGIFVLAPLLRSGVEPFLQKTLGFLPIFSGPFYGVGYLAGGMILAVMIIPTIAAISRDILQAVPNSQREAMLALGATRWETIWGAVLPYGRTGILGGVILGLGRALGETMAVTMVIGNRPAISASLFAPGYTLASVIANEFTEATDDMHVSALISIGLMLLAITIVVNAFARLLVWRINQSTRAPRARGAA
jgi:phosphate transport system permease protein